ncbi:unnamed protein product [Parascedosporium putredinis]|uniref:Beta-xylosidase C-terminal Concanavalin A-like domain-containing protein n=1 Tax=Parascedosporium putredinis TaxID=1442378 RepID=A0A9P1H329_9PEZI|nr:unnamed protein product [Parascedosporium putredinis]CAI7994162.1 unnamed protein product [Parascedosporium putredinis]
MPSSTLKSLSLLLACQLAGVLSSPVPENGTGQSPNKSFIPRADATFANPVLWEDYPDLDVFRSYDLVNWEPVTHSVPTLTFGSQYDLVNSRAYVGGIWASSLRYRESNDMFYWMGCVSGGKTSVWTAPGHKAATNGGEVSEWEWTERTPINRCYYDNGIFIDNDDSIEVKTQEVYVGSEYIEGARMYRRREYYYILVTRPANAEFVLRSRSVFGPYEQRTLLDNIKGPSPTRVSPTREASSIPRPATGTMSPSWTPTQGPHPRRGTDYLDLGRVAGAGDRQRRVGHFISGPVQTDKTVKPPTGLDTFSGPNLSHEWEWNHNPDNAKWALKSSGLVLGTATVTEDLFAARNTLTHRILGPKSIGTFYLDISGMRDGDRAGPASSATAPPTSGLNLSEDGWATTSAGKVAATGPTVEGSEVWLRHGWKNVDEFGAGVCDDEFVEVFYGLSVCRV